jgi:hypothetical protein
VERRRSTASRRSCSRSSSPARSAPTSSTESLVFTAEIFKGAFAGTTTTVRLTINDPTFLAPNCPPISGVYYGSDGESSVTVP